ncbi:hypothetical protein [Pleurocapsa sp. FMAR1]|uniref:hypothetical protein n=1 Tax=Pleurocapsa sp. FMAR1 TaxID=3040204 RepID=UPI0029C6A456|nr:hypothetical protein [Pleurocapsa sp. FMAR1]
MLDTYKEKHLIEKDKYNNVDSRENQSPKILSRVNVESDLATKIQVIKYFHEYIRRTGNCSVYSPLLAHLEGKEELESLSTNTKDFDVDVETEAKVEIEPVPVKEEKIVSSPESAKNLSNVLGIGSSIDNGDTKEKLTQDLAKVLEEVRKEISKNCIIVKENTSTISQYFLTDRKSSNFDEKSLKSADDEELKVSNEILKEQLYQLSKNIHYLVELARQYTQNTKLEYYLDSNNGLELHSMDESTMIFKLSRDLLYFLRYIQNKAIASKIKQDLFYSFNPNDYLERLNHYLDVLPEAGNNLVNALQSRLAKDLDKTSEEESDPIVQAEENLVDSD